MIYDIKQTKSKLPTNQYYLVVADNGFLLLTKSKQEANIVSKWKGIIFSGIVDRAKHSIIYGKHIEKLKNIPISQPYNKDLCFDFQNLSYSYNVKDVTIRTNTKNKQKNLIPITSR